tara:strand:+ start:113 stop:220 length:108 start_codon:yes stop_codon:yes gene_type:complete
MFSPVNNYYYKVYLNNNIFEDEKHLIFRNILNYDN